ncbi:MAG: SGNH/GDSL hydrolase family protein [Lentisphaeria bacterium]|nr:SGNH/GDSL hydrolase family protein [Lentisphaeria bacterium]
MKHLAWMVLLFASAAVYSAEVVVRENFERGVWRVDRSWRGKTQLTAEKPRSGKKAMLLSAEKEVGKCGNTRGDFLLGEYEYSLYACGTGELQLGVIRYDRKNGKLLIREDKQKVPVKLGAEYRKITFPFEIKRPNPSRIMLTITVRGKDSYARIDDLQLLRIKKGEPDFKAMKSAPQMQKAAAKIKAAKQTDILYIGDSLTDFYRGGNHLDMVNYFLKANNSRVTFYNYACRGDFISRVIDRFNKAPKVPFRNHYKGIWDRKYKYAFVLLGANDSVQRLETGKMAVPVEEVEKKYRELFGIFKKHGIEKVVIVSPASSNYAACKANAKRRIAAKKGGVFGRPENIEAFAGVMKKLSAEYKFPYVDIYTPMKSMPGKAELFSASDGVHLTPAGHEFVALKELEFLSGSGLIK